MSRWRAGVLAALLGLLLLVPAGLRAHEVVPAIADMSQQGRALKLDIRLNLEGILAGIDLGEVADTNEAPQAERYDALRAMAPDELAAAAREAWPEIARGIHLDAGGGDVALELAGVEVIAAESPDVARDTILRIVAGLPAGAEAVRFRWDPAYGAIVLRQQGVEEPFTGFLQPGEESVPIALTGGGATSGWEAFWNYVPVGFRHILPLGTDHILFVLGLFFLSTRIRPLLIQVSTFTVAHTLTLALAASGRVEVPAAIVEPLIAASITFVAIENILSKGLSPWRPVVVFLFGLLHGLGFASVLEQFGLPQEAFVPALVGFNVGVELGQLAIILGAYALVGYWFGRKPWYRAVIAVPASAAIAIIGAWWVLERTVL